TPVPLPSNFDHAGGYPVVKFDSSGRLFLSFMAIKFLGNKPPVIFPASVANLGGPTGLRALGMNSNNGIFVVQSTTGGTTWGTPVAVSSNVRTSVDVAYDVMPDLAIDPTTGTLYVTWTRFYPGNSTNGFPRSDGTRAATGGNDVMIAVS